MRWRPALVPLLIWLVLALAGTGGLLWQQHNSRQGVVQRFQVRVNYTGDFVSSYTADLINRERVQAEASLTGASISTGDFQRAVAGFGYPAAVLLDRNGKAIEVVPRDPAVIGKDLTGKYAHLRTALWEGRPAVSSVVASAARGLPVVAFAVPFQTPSGRRVFSGAVDVRRSSLTAFLSSALSQAGARVQLVDSSGAIVAANRPITAATLSGPMAAALGGHPAGRFREDGEWWHYSSTAIPGTPWRLSAAVRESVLYASLTGGENVGEAAAGGAAVVGLLVVVAAGRARRSHRELQFSEHRFRRVFDGSRIAMTLTDVRGRFVRVNPAACELFGRGEQELIRMGFTELARPGEEHDDDTARLGRDCLAGRIDGFDLDKRFLHADGRVIDASVTTVLLRDADDKPQYFATQVVDMTERRALERARRANEAELADRADQLKQANAHLADFVAMLSHDVGQPLAGIVGLGELLLDDWHESADEEKQRDVQRMTAAGHRATRLVTDILTLAQLDAGALVARPVRIDLCHAVREAVAIHQDTSTPAAATPVTVVAPDRTDGLADPAHLQLILGNLLANAVKYGRPPITVTVTNQRDTVAIQVADRGEGVPEAFVPRLFERFARAETGVATTAKGTGLGLYLVHQLGHAGGLDISYQPNPEGGAAFVVLVPIPVAGPAVVRPVRSEPVRAEQ